MRRTDISGIACTLLLLLGSLTTVILAGCSKEADRDRAILVPPVPVTSWTTPDTPFACIPLTNHCLAPMPSNLLTIRDPNTATGLRINLTEDNYSEGIFKYASAFLSPSLLNAADGFSPAGQIVIPLQAPVDPHSLPSTLEASVRLESPLLLLETPSWTPVPFHVFVDTSGEYHRPPQHFIVMIPAVPLHKATTYVVIVTSSLRQAGGTPMPPYPGFERIKTDEPLTDTDTLRLRDLYKGLFEAIHEALGLRRQDILLAFDFTTRSEASLFAPMTRIKDIVHTQALKDPPHFTTLHIIPPLLEPSESCEVLGTYSSPSFRTPDDKVLDLDDQGLPRSTHTEEITLLLKLPAQPPGARAPLVIFGHGLWVSKETVFQISEDLLSHGFAIAAIDAACHGSRIRKDGFIGDLFQLETVMRATACLAQTIADELQLVELIKHDLSNIDLLPYDPYGPSGDGAPDVDAERIYYLGQSMGTVLGLTFTALCPEIRAAVLNVPGCGIVDIVTQGTITAPLVGRQFIPRWTSPLDASLLYISGQMYIDYLDPVHYGMFLAHDKERDQLAYRPILLQEAIHDGLIPNWNTDILVRMLGIPVIEPYVYRPYGVPSVAAPASGSGAFQYSFTTNPFFSHLLMLLVPESRRQILRFLLTADQGSPVIINPFE